MLEIRHPTRYVMTKGRATMNLLCHFAYESAKSIGFPWFVMVHHIVTVAIAAGPRFSMQNCHSISTLLGPYHV